MVTVYSVPTSRHLTDQNGPPFGRDTTLGWSNPKGVQGLWDSGLTPRIHTEK